MSEIVPGTPVEALDTPVLLVDLDRLERNIRTWQDAVAAAGARLRPHVKTHKIPEIAELQLAAGACGIAVAKPSEAEPFVEHGIADVVVAYPVVGRAKWERLARLAAGGAAVAVNVDAAPVARGLSEAAEAHGARLGVQLEVDTGLHRVGHAPDALDELEALGRLVASLPGLELEGVTTHRGVFYPDRGGLSPDEAGLDEGRTLVEVAERLRERGLRIREVTAGGTPSGRGVARVPGVTEVRAGTYVFNDLMQLALGAAREDELALSVLCTVVSRRGPYATIDGGSKTFSSDRVPGAPEGRALARAADRAAWVAWMSEEHGMVGEGAELLEVGEKVAWHPAHVCTCVNLADELVGVRGGRVEVAWPVAARGLRR